jgi:hypothetical protein
MARTVVNERIALLAKQLIRRTPSRLQMNNSILLNAQWLCGRSESLPSVVFLARVGF